VLEEAQTKEVHWSQAVESTNDSLEQLTVINEPEAEDFEAVVERPQLTTSALKKGPQMMDNSIISLRMNVSDKLGRHEIKAIKIPYKMVCKDMQKKVKQSKTASFSIQSSVPPPSYNLHGSLTLTI
jgi:hypothetical protein